MYTELSRLVGDRIQVSTASEEEWLDNILELGWRLYLCSTPPMLLQTAVDHRIHDYTQLAFAGDAAGARRVRDSLQPAREAFQASKPDGKPQAHSKVWQALLGQVGGAVRVALTGTASGALRLPAFERALSRRFDPAALAGLRVDEALMSSDLHAGADYRAHLAAVAVRRAVAAALGGPVAASGVAP